MPEDSKRNQNKKHKQEAKDQRKPKQTQSKQHANEKNVHRTPTMSRDPESTATPEKNISNMDSNDVLAISEDSNSKYNKKEIKSNWDKYEIPIETYDEIEEQEQMGADYEKLVQAPMSAGGHFQFKHEKSWDSSTTPSEFDKYFNIDMDNLAIGLCSIPFHERNGLDISLFTDTDVNTMQQRATKYKRKYYNDAKFTTPELDASEKILSSLKADLTKDNMTKHNLNKGIENEINVKSCGHGKDSKMDEKSNDDDIVEILGTECLKLPVQSMTALSLSAGTENTAGINSEKVAGNPVQEANKPVVESPEDLEKWLDDFLDS